MAILTHFTFTGNTDSVDTDTNSAASFVDNTALYFNDGLSSASGGYFVQGAPVAGNDPTFDSSNPSVGFRLTANEGQILNLDNFSINTGNRSVGIQATYQSRYYLRSSVDNYESNILNTDGNEAAILQSVFSRFTTPLSISYDLTGSQYQNISDITFRFFTFDSNSNANVSLRVTYMDNAIIEGNTALVPEPAFLSLIVGCIALGYVASRKRFARRR